jgi:hypothetical protein
MPVPTSIRPFLFSKSDLPPVVLEEAPAAEYDEAAQRWRDADGRWPDFLSMGRATTWVDTATSNADTKGDPQDDG